MPLIAKGVCIYLNNKSPHSPSFLFSQMIRVMKIITFILFVFCLKVSATATAQEITLSQKNVSLEKVFREIKRQVGYSFFYTDEVLQKASKVSLEVKSMPLEDVLNELFKTQPLTYTIIAKTIVIKSKSVVYNTEIAPPPPPIKISGVIKDDKGNPLEGVAITIVGTKKGVLSNARGEFNLDVPDENAQLEISYIGFATQKIKAGTANKFSIVLVEAKQDLDNVIVVGYGSQKKGNITAAITTVTGAEIMRSPTSNITNSLIGRLTGLSAVQRSGQPGKNEAIINIRGSATYNNTAAIVIIDGVERSGFGDIDPNEIETISVLKDAASTAIFGIKGANGVIVITTKSGKEGIPRISYSGNVALQGYTGIPKALSSYDNATLMNEAMINDGIAPRWDPTELQKFKDGSDPLGYPDVNWFEYLTRKNYLQTQHNVNVNGGTKLVKYFASVGYLFEDGIFKKFNSPFNIVSTPSYTRYNFRSNLDFNLSKNLQVTVRLGGKLGKRYQPAGAASSSFSYDNLEGMISRILQTPSFAYPVTLPDGRITQNPEVGTNVWNPLAVITRWGTRTDDANTLESTFNINYKLDFITKGLSFKSILGYDSYFTGTVTRNANWAAYIIDRKTKALTIASDRPRDEPLSGLTTSNGGTINSNLQAGFNYDRGFGKNNITGLILGTRQLISTNGIGFNAVPKASQGVVGRVAYNYNRKYFVELNAAYNGSENFAPGYQYGFFPAVSAGWTVTNEKFLEKFKWLDYLKIRGSYGIVGNDKLDFRLLFLNNYSISSGGSFGSTSVANNGVQFGLPNSLVTNNVVFPSLIGNPLITWETGTKRNLGFEATLFKKVLEVTVDLFDERRKDILTVRQSGLATLGISYPRVNIGEVFNKGYEVQVKYQNSARNFNYGATVQLSCAHNTIINRDEPLGTPILQKQAGNSVGQFYGFVTDGFYNSAADIASSTPNNLGLVIPGDLKYRDLNKDGVITSDDTKPIGYSRTPEYIFSFSPNLSYKGFSLNLLFQGVTNVSSDVIFTEQNNGMQIYEHQLDRWTPATAATAKWPVLHNRGNAYNNYRTNDYLLQDGSYIKLRNAEFAWSLPKSVLKKLKMSGVKIFLNGQNLITWTKFKMFLDPENVNLSNTDFSNRSVYPTSKVYNFGFNIQL